MSETVIDLIRHGEPVGGRAYRGHNIDDPLSEKGWQQMWSAVGSHCPWQHIVSSPLTRCLSFARALSEDNQCSLSIEENLKEVGFGSWEGKTPDELKASHRQEYDDFYSDPVNKRPPGAEDLDAFIARVVVAFNNITASHAGQHILLVSHAGVMRAVIAHVLQAPAAAMYRIKIENAGITRVRLQNGKATLEFINGRL